MTVDQAFTILGITDETVDELVVKKAFYEAARLTHPDSNPGDANAIHKFNMIKEAYDFLSGVIKVSEAKKLTNYAYRKSSESSARKDSSTWKDEQLYRASSKKNMDTWDYYEEADRKYSQAKKRQAERKAEETMRRRAENERLRRMQMQQEEELHRQREKARQEELYRKRQQRMQQENFERWREGMNMADRPFERRQWDKRKNMNRSADMDFGASLKRHIVDFYYKFMYSIVKLGWLIEFVSFTVISIACIVFIISVIGGGYRDMPDYARSIATLLWWTMAISLSWRITKIIREYYGDRIILCLLFLVMMELGLFFYKMLGDLLAFAGVNMCNIILITIAVIYEVVIYVKIIKSLRRKTDKSTIVFVSGEIVLCGITGIIFSIASMVINARLF